MIVTLHNGIKHHRDIIKKGRNINTFSETISSIKPNGGMGTHTQ